MSESAKINLTVNGEFQSCAPGITLRAYLEDAGTGLAGIVAELNGAVIRAESFDRHILKDGDRVEFVRFVGGG